MRRQGFTLVELSIVIVIIGLIVAGVVAGQSLVQQAKIRSTLSKMEEYNVAVSTFKLTYDQLPGDMANASSYWGSVDNGNGDKVISWCCNDPSNGGALGSGEEIDVWEHLVRAGLISGSYDGAGQGAWEAHVPGVNVPVGILKGSNFGINGGHVLNGGWNPTYNNAVAGGAFTSQFVYNIDKKFDDGVAGTGRIIGFNGVYDWPNTQYPCIVSGDYDIDENTGIYCVLMLKLNVSR